jgi:hypothetical protein
MSQAIVRQHIEKIDGVSRTWFEWTWEDTTWVKTLVVEVNFDTDPEDYEFRRAVLDAIHETASGVPKEETTMIVSHLKIVPTN